MLSDTTALYYVLAVDVLAVFVDASYMQGTHKVLLMFDHRMLLLQQLPLCCMLAAQLGWAGQVRGRFCPTILFELVFCL